MRNRGIEDVAQASHADDISSNNYPGVGFSWSGLASLSIF